MKCLNESLFFIEFDNQFFYKTKQLKAGTLERALRLVLKVH